MKFRSGFIKIGLLGLIGILPILTQAVSAEKKPSPLTASYEWPTASEIKEAVHPWPKNNPFHAHDPSIIEQWKVKIAQYLPGAIAAAEFIYPGATYAMMGRDAFTVGDAIDLFYLSLGQKGRVIHLRISGKSFARDDLEKNGLYLASNGLETKSQEVLSKDPPFVLMDRSGYGPSSQSVALLRAGFHMMQQKISLEIAAKKFGFLNIGGNNGALSISKEVKATISGEVRTTNYLPINLTISPADLSDGPVWHQHSFASLQLKNINGKNLVFADRAQRHGNDPMERDLVLALVYEMDKIVSTPVFLAKVQSEAKSLGYEFPLKAQYQPVHALRQDKNMREFFSPIKEPLAEFRVSEGGKPIDLEATAEVKKPAAPSFQIQTAGQDLANIVNGLNVKSGYVHPDEKRHSGNALFINKWLDANLKEAAVAGQTDELLLVYLYAVGQAGQEGKITQRDVRYMLARVLSETAMTETFKQELATKVLPSSPLLQDIWQQKKSYFLDENPQRKGGLKVVSHYKEIDGLLTGRACEQAVAAP